MAPRKKSPMSDEHKAALADGRAQSRAVRQYLEAIEATRRGPGRRRSPESLERRIAEIVAALPEAGPMGKLELVQEKIDLESQLASAGVEVDLSGVEEAFVALAGSYAERKGISNAAFRAVGVPAAVLKRAGISRSR